LPKNLIDEDVVGLRDCVSYNWHITPIKESIFCSELFQGKKRELITRQAKPKSIRDVETPIIPLR